MNEKNNIVKFPSKTLADRVTCAVCGSSKVTTKWLKDRFEYGSGDTAVYLEVEIPVHSCVECSFEFTDQSADLLQHEAICRHLRLLTPLEVRAVRQNMSRAEFSRQTGIGEASLNRWEKGTHFQNVAMDNFLYLLRSNRNLESLRKRNDKSEDMEAVPSTFQAIDPNDERLMQKAVDFCL